MDIIPQASEFKPVFSSWKPGGTLMCGKIILVYLLEILVPFCEAAGGDCCQRQDLGYDPVLQFLCSSALPKCYFKNSCLVACLKDKCNLAILGSEWISKLSMIVNALTNCIRWKRMQASTQEEKYFYLMHIDSHDASSGALVYMLIFKHMYANAHLTT